MKVWVAFRRGEFFGESEPPGPPSFVGAYATREEALEHCWPPGDDRWVQETNVAISGRDLSYDELSKVERWRAREQTRLEEWVGSLQRNLDMAIAERDQAQAELRAVSGGSFDV